MKLNSKIRNDKDFLQLVNNKTMKLNSKIRNDKDNFYLEVINPVTNKKELKQLDLVKDTIEIEEQKRNQRSVYLYVMSVQ